MDVAAFVAQWLPRPRSTLLEVGCGDGELARALADQGHLVTAIDPKAPTGRIFRQLALEDFEAAAEFDAVVANRSLHHVHDLDAALGKVRSLLKAEGVLILNEFAWDQMDESTAAWYRAHFEGTEPSNPSLEPGAFPGRWVEEHAGLHTSTVLEERLVSYFTTEVFEWVPYIARNYLYRVELENDEAEAISDGRSRALGFRYVGRKLPSPN